MASLLRRPPGPAFADRRRQDHRALNSPRTSPPGQRRDAANNPAAAGAVRRRPTWTRSSPRPCVRTPLRKSDTARRSPDGASRSVVLATPARRSRGPRSRCPAWIARASTTAGEVPQPGAARPPPSLGVGADRRGARGRHRGRRGELAELTAPVTSPGGPSCRALGLGRPRFLVNPSGGALTGDPLMATGLVRVASRRPSRSSGQQCAYCTGARRRPAPRSRTWCAFLEGDILRPCRPAGLGCGSSASARPSFSGAATTSSIAGLVARGGAARHADAHAALGRTSTQDGDRRGAGRSMAS
ncbi:hypothetical protein ACU686_31220 [Yinghuangia aomiensis]